MTSKHSTLDPNHIDSNAPHLWHETVLELLEIRHLFLLVMYGGLKTNDISENTRRNFSTHDARRHEQRASPTHALRVAARFSRALVTDNKQRLSQTGCDRHLHWRGPFKLFYFELPEFPRVLRNNSFSQEAALLLSFVSEAHSKSLRAKLRCSKNGALPYAQVTLDELYVSFV